MISVAAPSSPVLQALLQGHPLVELKEGAAAHLEFQRGDWLRTLKAGATNAGEAGLVELADNNPWVCADSASVPSAASTLALIALGPMARACQIQGEVILQFSRELETDDLAWHLQEIGVSEDVSVAFTEIGLEGVLALNAFVPVAQRDDWDEIDDLYAEAYGRSFYVRHFDGTSWTPDAVERRPWALYDLRLTPGEDLALITCRVMADLNGKAGAAQLVHAFNVMNGLEENLGIPEILPEVLPA